MYMYRTLAGVLHTQTYACTLTLKRACVNIMTHRHLHKKSMCTVISLEAMTKLNMAIIRNAYCWEIYSAR